MNASRNPTPKQAQQSAPSWRWLVKPASAGWAVLDINGVVYLATSIHDHDGCCTGWRLVKQSGEVYDVDIGNPGAWVCDCPDAEFRQRECKHSRALKAALEAHERETNPLPRRAVMTLSQCVAADFQEDL